MNKVELLNRVEAFLIKHKMSATSFGLNVCRDSLMVFRMRKGSEVREAKRNKILSFIENYEKSSIGVGQCVKHR